MQGENYQRITIVSFLIIGTLLALYLTINVGYDLFCVHNVWMYRDGLIQKVGFVALYVNLPLLFIAGLTSTISYFRKGHIWKPITKGIAVNIILWLILGISCLSMTSCSYMHNDNYLQIAEETEEPNMNFLFARNASLTGRIYMTFSGKEFKSCINTVTAFYNKYHTCSNCEDFVKNPEEWNFRQTTQPTIGDLVIQHNSKTGKAYHAAIIVNIEDGKYYINHAVRTEYIKNVELKTKSNLTFYEFTPNRKSGK